MLKKINLLLLFVLANGVVIGQNLVSNSNFETYSACPTSVAQLPNATGWMNVSGHGGSADYMNVCSTSTLVDVPGNAFGNQAAASGNAYIGFAMYYQSTPNFREYIQTSLTSPMVAGQTYTIQFKASLSDNSQYSAPCFQFYFSGTPLTWSGGGWGPITSVTPQVSSTNHITSKTAWTTFTEVYTASGGEQYMIMGNYRNDASTPGITPAGPGTYSTVYYYIDDFTITPGLPLPVELVNFNLECTPDGVELKWSTASEVNNDFFTVETSSDGIDYTAVAKIEGSGNSNEIISYNYSCGFTDNDGRYIRLSQTDFDGNVHYYDPEFITCEKKDSYVCPVIFADNNQVNIEINSPGSDRIELSLMDYCGRTINSFSMEIEEGRSILALPASHLSSGIYLVVITGNDRKCLTRFVHQ